MTTNKPIKEQLRSLYLQKWPQFKLAIENEPGFNKRLHPHLISTIPEFEKKWQDAELKIMIYGISTNGWECEQKVYESTDETAVDALMQLYENWYYGGGNWEYGEPFWNYFYAIRELLKQRLKKSSCFIWNNVFKTAEGFGSLEQKAFDVTMEEINILQPNVILVMGYNAGKTLHHRLSKVHYDNSGDTKNHYTKNENKKLYLFDHMDGFEYNELKDFLKKFVVTYHPNAHGNAGIKLKLFIEKLTKELNN